METEKRIRKIWNERREEKAHDEYGSERKGYSGGANG